MPNAILHALASGWVALPEWAKPALVIVLISFILRLCLGLLTRTAPALTRALASLIKAPFIVVFYMVTVVFGWVIAVRRKQSYTHFPFVLKAEKAMDSWLSTLDRLKGMRINWDAVIRFYTVLAAALIVYLGLALHNDWDSPGVNAWAGADRWLTADVLRADALSREDALETVAGWFDREQQRSKGAEGDNERDAQTDEPEQLTLKPGETGGNVRAEPVDDLNIDNSVTKIYPGQAVLYLGESRTAGGITWLHIQTEDGKTGWISSNIVQPLKGAPHE